MQRQIVLRAIVCTAVAMAVAAPAFAQVQGYDTPRYDTRLYAAPAAPPLEANYGLPTFGTQGNEVARRDVFARPVPVPAEPGVAKHVIDLTLPGDPLPAVVVPNAPYTTTAETSLFTTSQGMTTGDTLSSFTTK